MALRFRVLPSLETMWWQEEAAGSCRRAVLANHRPAPGRVPDRQGFQSLRLLEPFRPRLPDHAAARGGNRPRHFDHDPTRRRLSFFSPVLPRRPGRPAGSRPAGGGATGTVEADGTPQGRTLGTDRRAGAAAWRGWAYRDRGRVAWCFRWRTGLLGCRHRRRTSPAGGTIPVEVAVPARRLIRLGTGPKPTKGTVALRGVDCSGLANLEERRAHTDQLRYPSAPARSGEQLSSRTVLAGPGEGAATRGHGDTLLRRRQAGQALAAAERRRQRCATLRLERRRGVEPVQAATAPRTG